MSPSSSPKSSASHESSTNAKRSSFVCHAASALFSPPHGTPTKATQVLLSLSRVAWIDIDGGKDVPDHVVVLEAMALPDQGGPHRGRQAAQDARVRRHREDGVAQQLSVQHLAPLPVVRPRAHLHHQGQGVQRLALCSCQAVANLKGGPLALAEGVRFCVRDHGSAARRGLVSGHSDAPSRGVAKQAPEGHRNSLNLSRADGYPTRSRMHVRAP
ncbi:hypothetical protein GSI_04233 [Ganoderma sinense ZZ0214-1]|uniref:Uncharacterized protein n=1 Tax=Ganoderma sinense ZZ0214-1 TaxID=1077348 RepID=A0A2G8SIN6_9APHY|nr:hypothetical protein GSI_04233 [Ganoderma sinense ZZ0214-1]